MVYGRTHSTLLIALLALTLQACSWGSGSRPAFSGGYSNDGPGRMPNKKELNDAKPKWEPRTRAGNPGKYTVLGKTYYTQQSAEGYRRKGIASWYGRKFHGNKTANGEIYDMYSMSAAHKSLPIPSYVRVRNLNNDREVIVRVNDRGPFVDNREIDLSYAAAVKLGVFKTGTAPVEVIGLEVTRSGRVIDPERSVAATPRLAKPPTPSPTQKAAAEQLASMHRKAPAVSETYQFQRPEPVESATPTPSTTTIANRPVAQQWWVQAGAFTGLDAANALSLRLQSEGFPNAVIDTHKQSYPYKVRIGPFLMETHARWAQLSLDEKGLDRGFVVSTNTTP